MKKRVEKAFGKKVYLLGTDKAGIYYWLEAPSWDCDWYWGLGYIETYTNNKNPQLAKDINSHQHFDYLFFNKKKCAYDMFKEFFTETPLSDHEIWELLDLMKSSYTSRAFSDMLHRGDSHFISTECSEMLKNQTNIEKVINKIFIPNLSAAIDKLLSPEK